MNRYAAAAADLVSEEIAIFEAPTISRHTEGDLPEYRFIHALEKRVESLFSAIKGTRYWSDLVCDGTPTPRSLAILREMLLSIHWYQAHTEEAHSIMLQRLPRKKLRTLDILRLQEDETGERGRWALADYLVLGGNHAIAKALPPDPAIFAVSAVWWHMSEVEDPWAYLGAEYLFEYLAVKIAPPILEMCAGRGVKTERMHFLHEHATTNLTHAQLIRELIVETVTRFPETEASILRGFDYLQQVYPRPLWDAAYRRTFSQPGQTYRDPWLRYVDGLKP